MMTTILGLFETPHEASLVVRGLIDSGIRQSDISLILPDESQKSLSQGSKDQLADLDDESQTVKRVSTGMGAGAAAGGALGLLAGLGAFAVPGLGPILAAGPIVAALEGAGFGAIAGGLAGTLSGESKEHSRDRAYMENLKDGGALVLVHAEVNADLERIHQLMEDHGAIETAERPEPGLERESNDSPQTRAERAEVAGRPPVPPLP